MTRINNWKARVFVAFVAISTVLVTLQPAITYACAGTHCGG